MKKQKMSFQKLLCFKYKLNLLYLDIFCIFFAIVCSCILLQYTVIAPSEDIINVCENALYEYLENPSNFAPTANVSIILTDNAITATIPQAFTCLIATRTENQTYQITTHIKFCSFIFTYCIGFLLSIIFMYFLIECSLYLLIYLTKFFLSNFKRFKNFILKKVHKAMNNFERRQNQKGLKEYEIPRLKEIYQLGYNMGHADGLAEGSKMGISDFSYQN